MRRKGEFNDATLDTYFPYQVAIPAGVAAGVGLIRFYPSLAPRHHNVRRGAEEFIVLCFAVEAEADEFIRRSVGERFDPKWRRAGQWVPPRK